jgi:glycosyltransferase involved in cell wall biosynthesis
MRFLIITHVLHKKIGKDFFAYGPYVKEMNLWFDHVEEITIVSPLTNLLSPDSIDLHFEQSKINFHPVPEFNFISWKAKFKTLISLPKIFYTVISEIRKADHIHLRCPGNMGLVACFAQIFFPAKIKSAKYAGNWDPLSPQPGTYRLQQKILSNEILTQNMQVMVYGDWGTKSRNLVSFFTASYSEKDRQAIEPRIFEPDQPIQLIFAGSLHPAKNPILSCEVANQLSNKGLKVELHLYGEGVERQEIQEFIENNNLKEVIFLHGNVKADILRDAYKNAHFLIFASESEGWPKVVAESMFWACLPVTTPVSCVPQMIGNGSRGELVSKNSQEITNRVYALIQNESLYRAKCLAARDWSQTYTLEKFDSEIQELLAK